jgi:hypothetical protein
VVAIEDDMVLSLIPAQIIDVIDVLVIIVAPLPRVLFI